MDTSICYMLKKSFVCLERGFKVIKNCFSEKEGHKLFLIDNKITNHVQLRF